MLRLTPAQRTLLADKIGDLANLVAAGWVIGQLLTDAQISVGLIALGGSMWVWLTLTALIVAGGKR